MSQALKEQPQITVFPSVEKETANGTLTHRSLFTIPYFRFPILLLISHTENRLKYSFQSVFNAVPALHFRDDKVSIAKIRLVPITVSQLKCALHILIGDWYESWLYSERRTAPPE